MEDWKKELRYQINDAISFLGINPRTSGGWTEEAKRPIVEDLIKRIEKKVLPKLKEVNKNMGPADKPDTFRKEYTPLTDDQKTQMAQVKDKAQELLDLLNSIVPQEERSERSRCMAVARTNLETTIMWAVKGVTA